MKVPKAEVVCDEMNDFLAQFKQATIIFSGEKPPEDLAMSFDQPQS